MIRTVEQWKEILKERFPLSAAQRILGDLTDYKDNGSHALSDRQQLANALMAFAALQNDPND